MAYSATDARAKLPAVLRECKVFCQAVRAAWAPANRSDPQLGSPAARPPAGRAAPPARLRCLPSWPPVSAPAPASTPTGTCLQYLELGEAARIDYYLHQTVDGVMKMGRQWQERVAGAMLDGAGRLVLQAGRGREVYVLRLPGEPGLLACKRVDEEEEFAREVVNLYETRTPFRFAADFIACLFYVMAPLGNEDFAQFLARWAGGTHWFEWGGQAGGRQAGGRAL